MIRINSEKNVLNSTIINSKNSININNNVKRHLQIYDNEDIFILETILDQFIPMFKEINLLKDEVETKKIIRIIQDLIMLIVKMNNISNKNKKKKNLFNFENNLKLEERNFLYNTYIISSSEKNDGTFKFFCDDTLKINNISTHMIRGLLILIKEELTNINGSPNNVLLEKLKNVKRLIINENKSFDFKLLHILMNFIILKYCVSLREIIFEGTFYSRIDQIDIMIKNGVYLYFIHKNNIINKYTITNKIEFLNENVAFKHLHEYCLKNNIQDVNSEKIEFNKINIFSILYLKTNLESLILNKISIDKSITISLIIEIIRNNENLTELSIDKFVSLSKESINEILHVLRNLKNLQKFKLNIISSSKDDFYLLSIPLNTLTLKNFNLKLSRVRFEENDIETGIANYLNLSQTTLEKLSLKLEQFSLGSKISLIELIPQTLKKLSLGMIDSIFLDKFAKISPDHMLNLSTLKFSFAHITDDNYDNSFKNIIYLINSCKHVKCFQFDNFLVKYKHVCDGEIKNIVRDNHNLRKLVIRSEFPFHVQYLEGLYFYEYPKFLIIPVLFTFKKNEICNKLYLKKTIISNIFEFHRIKKEKLVVISYKI